MMLCKHVWNYFDARTHHPCSKYDYSSKVRVCFKCGKVQVSYICGVSGTEQWRTVESE